jgi:hypothetical protein
MQSTRISWRSSSAPTTDFYHGADIIAQSQGGNYSVVRVTATAVNRGSTGSFVNGQGSHTAAIDGYGHAQYSGTLPGGYATNQTRWDNGADIAIGHDGSGYMNGVTLRQTISGWWSNVQTASLGGFARIPKRPSPPSAPWFTEVLPTSVKVNWTFNGDQGGSAIDGYLLRYWPNAAGTGNYVDFSQQISGIQVVGGLTPGQEYRFVVYAHNGSADNNGYSEGSPGSVVRMLSGMWAKYEGIWRRTVPYVKVSGVWRVVSVFIKDQGVWKRGG